MGISYDTQGIPIDVLPIYLLNSFLEDFDLLVVDEFLKMNGKSVEEVKYGREKLLQAIATFDSLYGFSSEPILCSDFMRSEEYLNTFQSTSERIKDAGEEERILETIPLNKRHLPSARDYPVHELACVQFFSDQGFSLKIGPTKEKQYDEIMSSLGFEMEFAYLLDAMALGTKSPDSVVHYLPSSKGPNNGQRILLEDSLDKALTKLMQGSNDAMRYFNKIASVSGHLLGKDYRQLEEIELSHGKRLKRDTMRLVSDNILKPYKGVLKC